MSIANRSVVIVGGGFSGTVLALQLLRQSQNITVAVIDPNEQPARGLAYSTRYDSHILNVCSADMSAFPDDPEHFWRWAQSNWEQWRQERTHSAKTCDSIYSSNIHPRSFFPRAFYGNYLTSLLNEMSFEQKSRLQWIKDEAASIRRRNAEVSVRCKSGLTLRTEAVVLATGNFPPRTLGIPALTNSQRYIHNAWARTALHDLCESDEILLVGSGLTSVDMAIALHSNGFTGKIHILSRHGLLPQTHQRTTPWPTFWSEASARTTRGLLHLIRQQVDAAVAAGNSWHAVMDSLRPLIQQMWLSLPAKEQRRFLRHARAYWEIHRHRIAPEVSSTFHSMIASGQVQIHAGRLTKYREEQSAGEVAFCERSTGQERFLRVSRVINCSGPELNLRKVDSHLLRDLFQQGLVRQDPLALGLDVDHGGALLEADGRASDFLFALGPARKGSLWETTAVPDLRSQAAGLADHLLQKKLHAENAGYQFENLAAR